jgi:hypothetical protein
MAVRRRSGEGVSTMTSNVVKFFVKPQVFATPEDAELQTAWNFRPGIREAFEVKNVTGGYELRDENNMVLCDDGRWYGDEEIV